MSRLVEEGISSETGDDKQLQIAKLLREARESVTCGNGAEALQKTLLAMQMNANGDEKAMISMLDR